MEIVVLYYRFHPPYLKIKLYRQQQQTPPTLRPGGYQVARGDQFQWQMEEILFRFMTRQI